MLEGAISPHAGVHTRARDSQNRKRPVTSVTRHQKELNDCDLADAFVGDTAHRLIHVSGKWRLYEAGVWRDDALNWSRHVAKGFCQAKAASAKSSRERRRLGSAKTVAAVLNLAAADPRIAVAADVFDSDPWLLNTPGGVVDLTTGRLLPHDPTFMMSRTTAVAPEGDCPLFKTFLARIFRGRPELIGYLQKVFGYCLTGITSEQQLWFAYGSGGNGKSVLIETIARILADYAITSPMETFASSGGSRHETELARLRGARLVTASETEEGRQWNESRVKAVTGGEKIAARFMHSDYIEFVPQFKPWFLGNHKPTLRSVDDAMKRRINLVPFLETIAPGERDPSLTKKLEAEWPGILRWAIEGCLKWQQEGLSPPEAIKDATSDYLASEDALAVWLDEHCAFGGAYHEPFAKLYASWKQFAERMGEEPGSAKAFSNKLEKKGFQRDRLNKVRCFTGLTLMA